MSERTIYAYCVSYARPQGGVSANVFGNCLVHVPHEVVRYTDLDLFRQAIYQQDQRGSRITILSWQRMPGDDIYTTTSSVSDLRPWNAEFESDGEGRNYD